MAERFRAYGPKGDVVLEGDVTGPVLDLNTDAPIAYVVLYGGPVESETVVGRIEVSSTGSVRVQSLDLSDID